MDIFTERRSIRCFKDKKIQKDVLDYIADCGRLAPSGANMQPVSFCIITKKAQAIFPFIKWAGYLPDWNPSYKEAPPAYIALLGNTYIKKDGSFELDAGITGSTIILAAQSKGISSCWLGAIDRQKISELLQLPENMKLLYLIALGYNAQESTAVEFSDTVKYTMDENKNVYVPKRGFNDIVSYN